MPQREINAVALLRIQVRIADIENENARMRAIVIKLFESWRAEGVLIVSYKRAPCPKGNAHTRTAGKADKVVHAKVAFRVVTILFDASAELKTNALKVDSL